MRIFNSISSSQLIKFNPILQENYEEQLKYIVFIKKQLKKTRLNKLKSVKAQMQIYNDVLNSTGNTVMDNREMIEKYHYLLPFDFVFILGYDISSERSKAALKEMMKSCKIDHSLFTQLVSYCSGKSATWKKIKCSKAYELFPEYLELFRKNYEFIRHRKYKVLITATMSAGKSTLINALCGKKVALSQNIACTSQLHYINSKPFEDGYTYEYDHDMVLDAESTELLNDNPSNKSGKITVSTYFNGGLSGKHIVFCDTPGVNSFMNDEHGRITAQKIKSKSYDCVIYLLNASQLGTTDDDEHLRFVKRNIGKKPIIFILNKIDLFNNEDEDAISIINKHKEYLKSIGFDDPLICPLSAKYAFLSKREKYEELSRIESRELERVMLNFEDTDYSGYYKEMFPELCGEENQSDDFMKKCGIEYIEKILCSYIAEKEKKNG